MPYISREQQSSLARDLNKALSGLTYDAGVIALLSVIAFHVSKIEPTHLEARDEAKRIGVLLENIVRDNYAIMREAV